MGLNCEYPDTYLTLTQSLRASKDLASAGRLKTWGKRSRRGRQFKSDLRFSPGGELTAWGIRIPSPEVKRLRNNAQPAATHAAGLSACAVPGAPCAISQSLRS